MGGRAYAATRRAAPKALRTLATRSRRVRVAAGVVPGRKLVRHREGGSLPSAVQVAMAWAPVRDVGPSLWRRADASRLAGRDLHSLLCNRERSAWFLVTACVRVPKPAASAGARNPVHRRAPRSTPLRSDLRDGIPKPERRLGEQHGSLKIVFGPSLVVHARSSTQRARPPLHLDEIPVAELTGRSPTDAPAASSHAPLTSPDTTR